MKGLLIIWAIACFGGSVYGAFLGAILYKNAKKAASAVLFCLSIVLIAFSVVSLIAI